MQPNKYYLNNGVKHWLPEDQELLVKIDGKYKIVAASESSEYKNIYVIDTNKLDWVRINYDQMG